MNIPTIENEEATEAFLAERATAPRVTLAEVNRLHSLVEYKHIIHRDTTTTIVSAYLNGFHLADGHAYCINEENFIKEYGIKSATEKASANAKDAIWKMLGTLLFAHNNPDLFKEQSND